METEYVKSAMLHLSSPALSREHAAGFTVNFSSGSHFMSYYQSLFYNFIVFNRYYLKKEILQLF